MKEVLITAGPTRQYIDTVRFVSNASSGLQAKLIAREFIKKNFAVTVVTGHVNLKYPAGCKVIRVETTGEMYEAVKRNIADKSAAIFAAAVCDLKYTPRKRKIKKSAHLTLRFEKAVDIAKAVRTGPGCVRAGFALEDETDIEEALRKKKEKNFDIIVLNEKSAMASASTSGMLIGGGGTLSFYGIPKKGLAEILCERICALTN